MFWFGWCCIENDHNFERNEDRATVFLKWTDFRNNIKRFFIAYFKHKWQRERSWQDKQDWKIFQSYRLRNEWRSLKISWIKIHSLHQGNLTRKFFGIEQNWSWRLLSATWTFTWRHHAAWKKGETNSKPCNAVRKVARHQR